MRLPTMSRYIGTEFLKMWFMCISGFYVIYLLVDFIERSSQLFKTGANLSAVALYFIYKSPMILFQMVPVATLLGTLLTLVVLSKNSEITALKSGGISVFRAVRPIFILAITISIFSALINEYVVPEANQKSAYVYRTGIKQKEWSVQYKRSNVYYKSKDAIYRFYTFMPEQGNMAGISVYRFDDDFNLTERLYAEKAEYKDGEWKLFDIRQWRFDQGDLVSTTHLDSMNAGIEESVDDFKVYQRKTEEMSYRELRAYVKRLEKEGIDTSRYQTDLQGKLAFPLVSVIMALLGVPFAVRHGRKGGVALGIGIAVVIGVVYWIVMALGLALGHSGVIPPFVAAWGSHLLFGAIGMAQIVKMEQ